MALLLCYSILFFCLFFLSALLPTSSSSLLYRDQQLLLQIKQHLNLNNSLLSDWNSNSSSPCAWSRITCSSDNDTRVVAIDLSSLSIQNLFDDVGFSGLTALSSLNLSNNGFSGSIPADISNCTGLVSLDLSGNSFKSFESSSGLSALSNLMFLHLQSNGIFADIGLCIPHGCAQLQTLNLSGNHFTGLFSQPWQVCTSLQTIDLSRNNLSDRIPVTLTVLPSLVHLSLADTQLHGTLPSPPCSENLQHLDFSENNITGTLPASIGSCASLRFIDLSSNNITGSIVHQLFNVTALETLKLSENLFTGPIPVELGRLTELQVFMAGSNSLTGEIPPQISNCTNLRLLDLNTNSLEGNLPTVLHRMSSLMYVVLHSNDFKGPIPSSVYNMSSLVFLDLSNNSLSGSISSQFANLTSLEFLILADNNFDGIIPPELGKILDLQLLDLSSNTIEGSIPSSLGNLQRLLWLTLAYNNLTGDIPPALGNCSSLLWLNLKNNFLTGELPSALASMGNNPGPVFSYNQKNVDPPETLGECLMMARWIPANNPPYSFYYDILGRQSCKRFWVGLFTGYPLSSGCGSTFMAYIQVSNNMLSGNIPRNLLATTLLLSVNNFSGGIPGSITNSSLQYLNISHNSLSGPIPDALGKRECLESLDLSYNNLSGSLPQSLGGLSKLSTFNVSYNPFLTGSIPSSAQFLTFQDNSYFGDPLLCYDTAPGMTRNSNLNTSVPFCNHQNSDSTGGAIQDGGLDSRSKSKRSLFLSMCILGASVLIFIAGVAIYMVKKCMSHDSNNNHEELLDCKEKSSSSSAYSTRSSMYSQVHLFQQAEAASLGNAISRLSYNDILLATNDFHEGNVVGHGGFGTVYKATLADGSIMAVKKLARHGAQGEKEFLAEMETLGTVSQENLVPLLGCYSFGSEKLLFYKFLCNGSLEDWLHTKPGGHNELTWPRRLRIAYDCAKAMSYLHHECHPALIHRDLKASNILLDERFHGYVADFGLARVIDPGYSHVSTVIAGTLGYVPPEYCQTWRAAPRGDVYSFGVVMLELITGRKPLPPVEEQRDESLVEWAKRLTKQSKAQEAYHETVKKTAQGQEKALNVFFDLAVSCTSETPEQRPSMKEVESNLRFLHKAAEASRPAHGHGIL